MFEQAVSSVSRQSPSTRQHGPPPHQQTARQQPYQDSHTKVGGGSGNNTDKQLQSQLGQIVAKALVILESEFMSPSTGGGVTKESTTTTANSSSKESQDVGSGKSPSKAALAAISGLEHVRDILLSFTKDLDPLVIESGMLDKPTVVTSPAPAPKVYNSPKTSAQLPVERTPINAARQDNLHPNNTKKSPSRSTSDNSITERQSLSRNSSQASDLSGFSSSGDPQEYRFNPGGSGSTPPPLTSMAEMYMPAPVPPPPAPKPFSFDDLLGDSATDTPTSSSSSASRKGSPPSSRSKTGTGLAGSGLANKVKSPRSSLANSQFSWMLDDSGDDGLSQPSAAKAGGAGTGTGTGTGGGGGGAARSSMDLFSPGSSRMKIDPLAGSPSRGAGILGGGGSSAGAGVGGGGGALHDDDPLRT